MTRRALLLAIAAWTAGCSSVLGFKDPTVASGDAPDAMIGGPGSDGSPTDAVIDGPIADAMIDGPPGACDPATCAFGCEPGTQTCRPSGTLYLFASTGLYTGSQFGGADNTVRATSDGLCFQSATTRYPALRCDRSRSRAVLQVSSADSLGLMATAYRIPTTAEVHRADDNALVASNWNELINTSATTRPPVTPTTATTENDGAVWTGATGTASCTNWTSSDPSVSGNIGRTDLQVANWLTRSAKTCDSFAKLLCICWSGEG